MAINVVPAHPGPGGVEEERGDKRGGEKEEANRSVLCLQAQNLSEESKLSNKFTDSHQKTYHAACNGLVDLRKERKTVRQG